MGKRKATQTQIEDGTKIIIDLCFSKRIMILIGIIAVSVSGIISITLYHSNNDNEKSKPLIIPNTLLITMVKNERFTLPRLLKSVTPYLHDSSWVLVCDTGSTDGTLEWLKEQNILRIEHPWVNFAFNRNVCLKTAAKFIKNRTKTPDKYNILFLDADHVIRPHKQQNITSDLNMIQLDEGWVYRLPYLMSYKAVTECTYKGVTHEFLDCPTSSKITQSNYNGFTIKHYADGGNRKDKFTRDFYLLKKAMEDKSVLPNMKRRYSFYLARTLEDMGEYEKALPWYKQRAQWGGWIEEAFFAQYRVAICMTELGYPNQEVENEFIKAIEMLPYRVEPYYHLATMARLNKNWGKCVQWSAEATWQQNNNEVSNSLFIDYDIYEWKLRDEYALCLYYSGSPQLAKHQWKILLENKKMPEKQMQRIKNNLEF
jgi:glycosyltransferase involved in cell wall biosynthesis